MNCNCNKKTNCGCNTKENCIQQDCSCPIKDFPTDCIKYTGETLECSGIESNILLTDLIEQLDAFICDKFDFATNYFQLVNIGGGAEVYKGVNLSGGKELRTIISENTDHLDIIENANTIGIKAGIYRLELDSSTEILSLIVETNSGDTTLSTIDLSEYTQDIYVDNVEINEVNNNLTVYLNNGDNFDVDLSYLNNHVESASYNTLTNNIELTLTDSSVITVSLPTSTETQKGLIEIATQAEVDAGVDDERAVTPAKLNAFVSDPSNLPIATETQRGIAEIATQAEVDAGVDDERYITPAKLKQVLDDLGLSNGDPVVTYLIQGKVTVGVVGGSIIGTSLTVNGDFTSASVVDDGAGETTIQVNFPSLPNNNYQVVTTFYSNGTPFNDNDMTYAVVNQNVGSFTVSIADEQSNANVYFISTLIPINFTF